MLSTTTMQWEDPSLGPCASLQKRSLTVIQWENLSRKTFAQPCRNVHLRLYNGKTPATRPLRKPAETFTYVYTMGKPQPKDLCASLQKQSLNCWKGAVKVHAVNASLPGWKRSGVEENWVSSCVELLDGSTRATCYQRITARLKTVGC